MSPEYESSWEHLSSEERRKKIAAHIADMRIGHRVLEESHAQQEAIQDFEARIYQLDAFNALWTARRDGADRGLIHLATGLGKTSVAVVDYAAFRQEQIERTGQEPRALFVVHQNNILEQAGERFAELLPDASRSFYSNRQKNLPNSGVTFASFQTLSNGAHRFPDDYFDYIIYDEAHHIEAKTYKKVVEYFKPQFQLGLTATPERMDEKDITDHFGRALYTKTLSEAIAEKHLATVNYNIVFDDAVKEAMQNGFEPSSIAEIQRLFDVQPRNEVIVEKIRDAQDLIRQEQNVERVKTIIFCADLEHADAIANMMNGESYHSGKDEHRQTALLDDFRGDGLEVITVRDMFNEGVDVPDARLIVFLRTTQSATIFEQQLGRGLRKNKDKQEVTVLDFVANIERITLIRELVKNIDVVRPPRSSGTKGSGRNGGEAVCGPDENIKVHGDDSEFIFSQEIVDLLEKYVQLKDRQPVWSAEDIIQLVNNEFGNKFVTTTMLDKLRKSDDTKPDANTIYRIWSSITEFNNARGVDIETQPHKMSEEEILQLANDLWPDKYATGEMIDEKRQEEIFVGQRWIMDHFGSVVKFNAERGVNLAYRGKYDSVSDEELLELAENVSSGTILTQKQISALSAQGLFPSSSFIQRRFGSITEFNRIRGLEVTSHVSEYTKLTNDELVTLSLDIEPSRKLTKRDIEQLSKEGRFCSDGTIKSRFGSLITFNELRGF